MMSRVNLRTFWCVRPAELSLQFASVGAVPALAPLPRARFVCRRDASECGIAMTLFRLGRNALFMGVQYTFGVFLFLLVGPTY